MKRLPSSGTSLGSTELWVTQNSSKITVETLLMTPTPRVDVLTILLERVRGVVRNIKIIKTKNVNEPVIRAEVRDYPSRFCFHSNALRDYSPMHLAEMIAVLLELLSSMGIDARSRETRPTV